MKKETTTFRLEEELSNQQVAFFEKHGYLHFQGFIAPPVLRNLLQAIREVEAHFLDNGFKKIYGVPLKLGMDIDGSPLVQRMAFASRFHPVLHEFLKDPRFAALFRLVGGNARLGEYEKDGLVVNHYVNASKSKFTQMGWHTDAIRDIFYKKKVGPMLNAGLHLDDFPASLGGLKVLPGTHKQGTFKMIFRKKYYLSNRPDPAEVGFDIKAGDLTVHDGRIWHRVARCPATGEESRRRVMYIPVINGAFEPKKPNSKTPFYHNFWHLVK